MVEPDVYATELLRYSPPPPPIITVVELVPPPPPPMHSTVILVPVVATPVHDVPVVTYIFAQSAAEDAREINTKKSRSFLIFEVINN
jgi:hypothetical protein